MSTNHIKIYLSRKLFHIYRGQRQTVSEYVMGFIKLYTKGSREHNFTKFMQMISTSMIKRCHNRVLVRVVL